MSGSSSFGRSDIELFSEERPTLFCDTCLYAVTSQIGYDPYPLFAEKGCQMMYEDKAVCAARVAGVRGLGTEITRRSELLAKELGCTGTYALVTGH